MIDHRIPRADSAVAAGEFCFCCERVGGFVWALFCSIQRLCSEDAISFWNPKRELEETRLGPKARASGYATQTPHPAILRARAVRKLHYHQRLRLLAAAALEVIPNRSRFGTTPAMGFHHDFLRVVVDPEDGVFGLIMLSSKSNCPASATALDFPIGILAKIFRNRALSMPMRVGGTQYGLIGDGYGALWGRAVAFRC
jgi:hypothetical protein